MPTTVTSTIGTSGTYSSWLLWAAAIPINLVTADQIWRGEGKNEEFVHAVNVLSLTGITADATRYIVVTTEAGASFMDNANKLTNALRYNASNGAGMRCTGNYLTNGTLHSTVDFTRVSKLQILSTSTFGRGLTGHGASMTIENVIAGGTLNALLMNGSGTATLSNVLAYIDSTTSDAKCIQKFSGTLDAYNVTCVRPSNRSAAGTNAAFFNSYATIVLKNCAGFGFSNFATGQAFSTSSSNNASDLAISFGSSNQASLTYANQIEQTDSATGLDCRTKAGANLIDTGVDLSGVGVTTDIVGTAR